MAYDPDIRASDTDRDRAASLLREHHAAGRLTAEEFSDRLDRAFAARTVGEIDGLLKDLPGIDLYRLPDAALTRRPRPRPPARRNPGRGSRAWLAAWGVWFTVSLVCFVIWGLTSAPGYVWPLWVAAPLGAVLAGSWVTATAVRGGAGRSGIGGGSGQGQLPRGDEDLPGRRGT
ncbi:MAG TPA: DUF1707 domain-containing protein [Streptosporangiaceae bacterium]|jgi:hypothetical protein